jgi:dihydroneopterin aldolase
MNDQIFLRRMEFEGRHGVTEEERAEPQTIELDVELRLDLRAAGHSDDLAQTVDYGDVFEICRAQVEQHTYHLLEGVAEAIATDILGRFPDVGSVVVRAMKPGVPLDGVVELAGVGIERSRGD